MNRRKFLKSISSLLALIPFLSLKISQEQGDNEIWAGTNKASGEDYTTYATTGYTIYAADYAANSRNFVFRQIGANRFETDAIEVKNEKTGETYYVPYRA